MTRRSFLSMFVVAAVAGCARAGTTGGADAGATRKRSDHLSHEEIAAQQYANVYDLIVALRPLWLNTRGRDTASGTPSVLQVHVNDVRAGTYEALFDMSVVGVDHIDFIDPSEAAARYGLGYNKGLIRVSTTP